LVKEQRSSANLTRIEDFGVFMGILILSRIRAIGLVRAHSPMASFTAGMRGQERGIDLPIEPPDIAANQDGNEWGFLGHKAMPPGSFA